jgi:hypothetical protein
MPPALAYSIPCPGLGLIYYFSECTQNTVMSYVTEEWHGLVYSSRPMPSLGLDLSYLHTFADGNEAQCRKK